MLSNPPAGRRSQSKANGTRTPKRLRTARIVKQFALLSTRPGPRDVRVFAPTLSVNKMKCFSAALFSSALLICGAAAAAELDEPAGPPLPPMLAAPTHPAPPLLAAPQRPAMPRAPRAADADAATYEHCMKLAEEDPAAGRDLAQHWRARGGAHPAEHCFAVAQIGRAHV